MTRCKSSSTEGVAIALLTLRLTGAPLAAAASTNEPAEAPEPTPAAQAHTAADQADILARKLEGAQRLTTSAEIEQTIAYGRDLLHNSTLDVRYYTLAIRQFELVMLSLADDTSSQHYQDAWALLQVAERMREKEYQQALFTMERNIALRRYGTALENAAYIYRLFPENAPERKKAEQRFNAIKQMMNN